MGALWGNPKVVILFVGTCSFMLSYLVPVLVTYPRRPEVVSPNN